MLVVWFTYAMWQSYLFSAICLYAVHVLYRQLLHLSAFLYLDNVPMYTNVITL